MKALLVYPTHKNCVDVTTQYVEHGIDAVAFPPRMTADNGDRVVNCWNQDADQAEKMGFSVLQTVCPGCRWQTDCRSSGYLQQIQIASRSRVLVATHQRATHMGLAELSQGRKFVSIHENPINILRPPLEVHEADLVLAQHVVDRVLTDPEFLDWFGDSLRTGDDGQRYEDEELAVRKDRQLEYVRYLSQLIDSLLRTVQSAQDTTEWKPANGRRCPEGMQRTLYRASRVARVAFSGQPWRFLLAAASNELHAAAIIVTRLSLSGNGTASPLARKQIIGFRHNPPHPQSVTWFNDATTTCDSLQAILGRAVQDLTPDGRLELQHKAVQVPRDVTRSTSANVVQKLIRGILLERSRYQRFGLICHRIHLAVLRDLEPGLQQRITKFTYFGSGEDRSSNDWHRCCDLIIVVGTPRPPPAAVAAVLVQHGEIGAACRDGQWGMLHWDGLTESREQVRITARGYRDEHWRAAHRSLVRAAIIQAVGRGRGILDSGCEVLVISTEECGFTITDSAPGLVNHSAKAVLTAVSDLSRTNPNKYSLGRMRVSTGDIANATKLSTSQVARILTGLEARGMVTKVGERGGWSPALSPHDVPLLPDPHEVQISGTSVG